MGVSCQPDLVIENTSPWEPNDSEYEVREYNKENEALRVATSIEQRQTPKRKRKIISENTASTDDDIVNVLKEMSSSVKAVATASNKVKNFLQYVESEITDLADNEAEEFIDETLIRLLQVKRRCRSKKSSS